MGDIDENCTEACEAQPTCTVCQRPKMPRGRSVPMEMWHCEHECPGHDIEPRAGHLWPGELRRWREEQAEEKEARRG